MQAVMETTFDIFYLALVIIVGVLMVRGSGGRTEYRVFGIMTLILGGGDAFHLIPRAIALCTTGLADYTEALGAGKLITSLTMTVFYVLLYYVWRLRYRIRRRHGLSILMLALAAARIVLCAFPQNEWLTADPPLAWGILRNIPFVVMGILVIILYRTESRSTDDRAFRSMWLAITLSFAFYIPVVLFAHMAAWVGMLMIPKTLAYIWAVLIGFHAMRRHEEPAFSTPRVR